jgi:ubiquinone biosynthesis protein
VHFDAGYVPRHHSVDAFAQAIRAIGEPIHNRTAEDISMAKLLNLLFEVTAIFEMRTRPELLLLQKTMVVVEGVARGLDPRLDMWSTAKPVVSEWVARHLGPAGRIEDVAGGAFEAGRFLAHVPELLGRAGRLFEPDDPEGLAAALDEVLTQPGVRDRMREAGWVQAQKFQWSAAATGTREAWALARESQSQRQRG